MATFLFTDIEGSTQLLRRLGERYSAVLREHREIIRAAITEYGGSEQGTEGDSFFVVFDNAADAVAAAVTMQLGLQSHNWGEAGAVLVRMGLHTGDARRTEDGVIGLAVHVAARVGATAHGGQVVISETTAAQVEDSLGGVGPLGPTSLTDLGRHRLKDVAHPLRIFQVDHPDLRHDFPRLRTAGAAQGNIGAPATSFIGRQTELREIGDQLDRVSLVTVTGPGGAGKSRLAVELARARADAFSGGAWLVEVAEVTSGAGLVSQLGTVLQLGQLTEEALLSALAGQQLLLILDNCEQIVAECARLVGLVMASAPAVRVLATSREPLGVSGEARYPLGPLELPRGDDASSPERVLSSESARLLVDRVRLRDPHFAVAAADVGAVASLVTGLEGNPLALELVASRIGVLSIAETASRLSDRFRLLGGEGDGGRHHTLYATVDWSYRLLPAPERALFERLAVFTDGATLDAVVSVCAEPEMTEWDVLDLLAALVSKSLVVAQPAPIGTRYRQLETIREFGLGKLRASGVEEESRRRHCLWIRDLVARLAPRLERSDPWPALHALRADNDNIAAAIAWAHANGDCALVTFIVGSLHEYLFDSATADDFRNWVTMALSCEDEGPYGVEVLIEAVGACEFVQDHTTNDQAAEYWQGAQAAARRLGDREREVRARVVYLDRVMEGRIAPAAVHDELQALMPEVEATQSPPYVATALVKDAVVLRRLGRQAEAAPLLERARALGDQAALIQPYVDYQSAMVSIENGDIAAARVMLERSLAWRVSAGSTSSTSLALVRLGALAREDGDLDEALRMLNEAVRLERRAGWPANLANMLAELASAHVAAGDLVAARAALTEAAAHAGGYGSYTAAAVSFAQGDLARAEGRRSDAERHYQEAVRQAADNNFRAIGVFADQRLEDMQRGG